MVAVVEVVDKDRQELEDLAVVEQVVQDHAQWLEQ